MGNSQKDPKQQGLVHPDELPYQQFAHILKRQSIQSLEQKKGKDSLEISPIHLSSIVDTWAQEDRKKLQKLLYEIEGVQSDLCMKQRSPDRRREGSPSKERERQRVQANNQNLAKRVKILKGEIDRIRCLDEQRRLKVLYNKKQNHHGPVHFHEYLFLSVLNLQQQSFPQKPK